MQIKVQSTKPNTSLERKIKNLCSHIEMQLDYIRYAKINSANYNQICKNISPVRDRQHLNYKMYKQLNKQNTTNHNRKNLWLA